MIGDVSASTGQTTSDEPVRRRARRTVAATNTLAARAEDLRHLVKDLGATPGPRAVHQLRTTIRRFETLLPDLGDAAPRGERKLRAQLDCVRKRAGKVRDADVHLLALRTVPKAAGDEPRAKVRADLQKQRAKLEKRLVRAVAAERDRGLLKRIRKVVDRAGVVGPQSDAEREAILARVVDQFDQALRAAGPLSAENLHAFRLQTKRLRYLAETASPHAGAATAVAQLKRVQDAIGAWHDWLTLAERAGRVVHETDAPAFVAALRARIDSKLARAVTVTINVGRRLLTLRPTGAHRGTRSMTSPPAGAQRSTRASA
jgi:CHAD domain-containing protein